MFIYVTADRVGMPSGGGTVTQHELLALNELWGKVCPDFGTPSLIRPDEGLTDPYVQDDNVKRKLKWLLKGSDTGPKLAHVYAGCFTESVYFLKGEGYRVTYTVAAHDVDRSRKAHEELGLPYNYPHLNKPDLFAHYIRGYRHGADVVIVPGKAPERVVKAQGCTGRVEIIPHGYEVPHTPWRKTDGSFTVGYLGAPGADKGLINLARAWAAHVKRPGNENDRLLLGGDAPAAVSLFQDSANNVVCRSRYDNVSAFYGSIDLYVQPSETEGFGITVLEAMGHGVPVICSVHAGAADLVPEAWQFDPDDDPPELVKKISAAKTVLQFKGKDANWHNGWVERALPYTWDKVRQKYVTLWTSLIGETSGS